MKPISLPPNTVNSDLTILNMICTSGHFAHQPTSIHSWLCNPINHLYHHHRHPEFHSCIDPLPRIIPHINDLHKSGNLTVSPWWSPGYYFFQDLPEIMVLVCRIIQLHRDPGQACWGISPIPERDFQAIFPEKLFLQRIATFIIERGDLPRSG